MEPSSNELQSGVVLYYTVLPGTASSAAEHLCSAARLKPCSSVSGPELHPPSTPISACCMY